MSISQELALITKEYNQLSPGKRLGCSYQIFKEQMEISRDRLTGHYPYAPWDLWRLENVSRDNFYYQLLHGKLTVLERMIVMDAVIVLIKLNF